MLEDGTLANIQFKGACVKEWSDFFNRSKNRLADEWVIVSKFNEGKKGAVKFTTPNFEFERSLTEDESLQADDVFDTLDSYLKVYLKKPIIQAQEEPEPEQEDEEDVAF